MTPTGRSSRGADREAAPGGQFPVAQVAFYKPVVGASGPIYFDSSAGFAVGKNIAFTTIDATGNVTLLR